MALINSLRKLDIYTDDFGNEYPNLNVKFGDNAPSAVLTDLYSVRGGEVGCGTSNLFTPRALIATFTNGSIHRFPLGSRATSDIEDAVTLLKDNDAACIDLEGESWSIVPQGFFIGTTTFKTTPFTDIPSAKVQESVSYNYSPDVQATGTVRLRTRMETAPSALNACQKSALDNATVEGGGICSGEALGISPRRYIMQALATKTGDPAGKVRRVVRNAIVSDKAAADILTEIDGIAPCAYCVGYRGESVKNIHLLFTATP